MAKKIRAYVKLQIPAGKATPAPPIGPALGQHNDEIFTALGLTAQEIARLRAAAII